MMSHQNYLNNEVELLVVLWKDCTSANLLYLVAARKINRDRADKWDDEEKREHLLQREALRELRMNEQKDMLKEKKIESKRADESMQAFKARIKQETRKVLAKYKKCRNLCR
jgi:hypothetical protein